MAAIVLRRRNIVLAAMLVGLILAALVSLFSMRRYQATAQIQVLKQESELSATRLSGNAEESGDPMEFNLTLQTYVNVLNSDTLALRVIDELHLRKTSDYAYHPHHMPWDRQATVAPTADGAMSSEERVWLLKRFHKNLGVNAVAGTRVIKVDFVGPHPNLAASVLNQLVKDFEVYNFQVRNEATLGPSGVLSAELDRLRQQVTTAETHVGELQRKAGNFGTADSYNVVLSRLEALNKSSLDAESNRVLKEAVYQVTRTGDPELISTLAGSGLGSSVQGGGLSLIQSLRQQQAQAKADYAQQSARYGENYPKLAELRQQMESINSTINQEVTKLGMRAKNDYLIAKEQEDATKQALTHQRALADEANNSTIAYVLAKGEADADRQLYITLSEKLRQVQLVAGLHSSNISLIDPARAPSSPSSPQIPLLLVGGALGGLVCGLFLAFFREAEDTSLRNVEEAEAISGLPLLGVIPKIPKGKASGTLKSSGGLSQDIASMLASSTGVPAVAESYRAVRTSLLLAREDQSVASVCMVTSAMKGDGKSTTTINIATVFAKMGIKTLIIDGDLRGGSLAEKLDLRESDGLAEALVNGLTPKTIQRVDNIDQLYAISVGHRPSDPSELLSSNALSNLLKTLRSTYEYIFIDSPPCIAVTDAVVLAKHVDNFIFVVRPGFTKRPALTQSIRRMSQAGVPCLGILVNAINPSSAEYMAYGGYGMPSGDTPAYEAA